MSDLDLTEAIGAAANSLERVPLGDDRKLLVAAVAAAAPVVERLVRERIAADIEAERDTWGTVNFSRRAAMTVAADIARGGGS